MFEVLGVESIKNDLQLLGQAEGKLQSQFKCHLEHSVLQLIAVDVNDDDGIEVNDNCGGFMWQ